VLAGTVAATLSLDWHACLVTMIAVSCFYVGGMFLNDAFDADFDRAHRPERPIPAGNVSKSEALVIGGILLLAGELLVARHRAALLAGVALAAAILIYDYRHKGSAIAPLIMGVCRGLVYVVAAAAAGGVTIAAVAGGGVMTLYVAGLTVVAKLAGRNARWLVPLLIAGISILDSAIILVLGGGWRLALVALAAFPLTLFLQRFIPGD
jgi:4-hydroxybenzoate polyprenyltransferase